MDGFSDARGSWRLPVTDRQIYPSGAKQGSENRLREGLKMWADREKRKLGDEFRTSLCVIERSFVIRSKILRIYK